ncbi:hypothetical protein ACHAXR_010318 [Thalassiosira sp. AJA248-18]
MSKQPAATAAATAAAAASPPHNDPLSGIDIGKVMSSTGPMVKCVLLRATPADKSGKSEEKIEAEAAPPLPDVSTMSIKEIKRELQQPLYGNVDTSLFVEKDELVKALVEARRSHGRSVVANNDDDDDVKKKQDEGAKEAANDDAKIVTQDDNDDSSPKIVPLQHLIEEVIVDTTPRKSMVSQILGGEFTFLGQYEEEGIMVIIRRPDWEAEDSEEDAEDAENEEPSRPPVNPHELQPPLHNVEVRGDILLMRVAETDEVLDHDGADGGTTAAVGKDYEKEVMDAAATGAVVGGDDDDNGKKNGQANNEESSSLENKSALPAAAGAAAAEVHVPTNDEFFLDYTKEEYLKFAARTDIVAEEVESSSEEEESDNEEEEVVEGQEVDEGATSKAAASAPAITTAGGDDEPDDEENDEDFDPSAQDSDDEEDFDSEEHQVGMMNMILGHMLRKFREENGRGPDSLELLEMRKALADRLGVEVPPVDEEACDWDKKSPSVTPKKHDKKVVVAEEKNETEEIPCREDVDDVVGSGGGGGEGGEQGDGEVVICLKRRAAENLDDDDDDDNQGITGTSSKRARINGENGKDDASSVKDATEGETES